MGVTCSKGSPTSFDEDKKPITKQVVSANGVNDATVPKQNGDMNIKTSSDQKSDSSSQLSAEVKEETVKVRAKTPDPVEIKECSPVVYKSLEVSENEKATLDERGGETPRTAENEKNNECRGIETTQIESKAEEGNISEPSDGEKDVTEQQSSNATNDVTDSGTQDGDSKPETTETELRGELDTTVDESTADKLEDNVFEEVIVPQTNIECGQDIVEVQEDCQKAAAEETSEMCETLTDTDKTLEE